jgi:hypothetical protein
MRNKILNKMFTGQKKKKKNHFRRPGTEEPVEKTGPGNFLPCVRIFDGIMRSSGSTKTTLHLGANGQYGVRGVAVREAARGA